jgi:hypothetical protein
MCQGVFWLLKLDSGLIYSGTSAWTQMWQFSVDQIFYIQLCLLITNCASNLSWILVIVTYLCYRKPIPVSVHCTFMNAYNGTIYLKPLRHWQWLEFKPQRRYRVKRKFILKLMYAKILDSKLKQEKCCYLCSFLLGKIQRMEFINCRSALFLVCNPWRIRK